jgi:hypothetical protein
MRSWIRSMDRVPVRHAIEPDDKGQRYVSEVVFSTGGNPFSNSRTRRWLDNYREYELVNSEWILNFSDNFESYSVSAFENEWNANPQSESGTDVFLDEAGPDSSGVDLITSAAFIDTETGNLGAMISRYFDHNYTGTMAIEWSQRHESSDDTLRAEVNATGAHQPFSVGMKANDPDNPDENGYIFCATANPDTGAPETLLLMRWEPNQWYRFRLEIDVPHQTYSLYVDGNEIYSGE